MTQPNYYAIIPAKVRYDKDLPLGARLLYGEVVALSNLHGHCFAGDQYFMNLYDVSKRTIQNWLSALENKGFIRREVSYKQGTKEIDKRYITIATTLVQPNALPYGNILHYPSAVDCTDSITSTNITSINKELDDLQETTTVSKYDKVPYFNEFWELYPKKVGKGQAVKTFKKQVTDKQTYDLIVKDLKKRKGFDGWLKNDGQFIQHPSTYLNQEMWLDEYDANVTETIEFGEIL